MDKLLRENQSYFEDIKETFEMMSSKKMVMCIPAMIWCGLSQSTL